MRWWFDSNQDKKGKLRGCGKKDLSPGREGVLGACYLNDGLVSILRTIECVNSINRKMGPEWRPCFQERETCPDLNGSPCSIRRCKGIVVVTPFVQRFTATALHCMPFLVGILSQLAEILCY